MCDLIAVIPACLIRFCLLVWQVRPNPPFLSDIAFFEAAIVAFLIPLSIEIISKISERYSSGEITRVFERSRANRYLPRLLVINIIVAIVLRFGTDDHADTLPWKIVAWVVLIFFIIVACLILTVVSNIKAFATDTDYIVKKLYEDIEKSLQ